jgi:hypothetical protein
LKATSTDSILQANFKEIRMVDFRKSVVLAAAVLALGVTASAQTYSCTGTTGAPPTLRSEGATELVGAIVITCTGVPAATTINVDLQLNAGAVPITSRAGTTSGETTNGFDAALQVSATGGLGTVVNTYAGTPITVGSAAFFNDVRFTAVSLSAGTDVITISGIRGNVSSGNVSISAGGYGIVQALISVSNGALPLQQNVYNVGLVTNSLAVSQGAVVGTINTCVGSPAIVVGLNKGTANSGSVKFSELFPTAFKVQLPAAAGTDSESGPNPIVATSAVTPLGASVEQTATTATQFAVTFAGVPSGVTLYVPNVITSTNANGGGTAVLVTGEGSTTPAATGVNIAPVGSPVITVNAATAGTTYFYNVVSTDPNSIDSFSLPVYPATAANNSAAILSNPTVTISYAPRTSTTSVLVPRFVAGAGAGNGTTVQLFATTGCQTTLLFPFLTNQAGFDTGMSIAATGTGKFGATDLQQGGTCTISLYGSGAPTTNPTLVVPTAGEGHTTISAVAPGFQGFGIAVCPFNYAHGFVFVTDGFMGPGKGLSEGYLPLVLLRGSATSGIGENLNN